MALVLTLVACQPRPMDEKGKDCSRRDLPDATLASSLILSVQQVQSVLAPIQLAHSHLRLVLACRDPARNWRGEATRTAID